MKTLNITFIGIDNFNRPVFKIAESKHTFIGGTEHLFKYDTKESEIIDFYKGMELNKVLCYFGTHFGCEPSGEPYDNIDFKIVSAK